ncbi:hypothetical protein CF050_18150 [Clostridium botulinum]|uniref:hypothetical protein n=1 Tax=Clostridium botulinum TaxID=1491 RepID=UPI00196A06C3|nr:hypothetical protein [Clostridium botulinum]MBN3348733.1 hypothetical protein [Clostridium botulinum]
MKKFLSITISAIAISTALFSVPVKAADHQHNWKNIDGGYSPAQTYTHRFSYTKPDGSMPVEDCIKTVTYSWYKRQCTKCGSTEKITENNVRHSNPHCPYN